jgi:hypothetical protein
VLGLALPALWWVAAFMFLVPVAIACAAAIQAPRPRHPHPLTRPLIAWLHFRQPIARGWARYAVRLKAKVMKQDARGYQRPAPLPFDRDGKTLRYWSKYHGRLTLIDKIADAVRSNGWRVRTDSGWNGWDMEIYGSRYVRVRLTTATEDHHGDENTKGKLTRVRVEPLMSNFTRVLLVASFVFAGLLLIKMWPFSRTAVLIPLTWWTMYLVNRWQVATPVLGLVDEVAEKYGYWPVHTPGASKTVKNDAAKPAEESDTAEPGVDEPAASAA